MGAASTQGKSAGNINRYMLIGFHAKHKLIPTALIISAREDYMKAIRYACRYRDFKKWTTATLSAILSLMCLYAPLQAKTSIAIMPFERDNVRTEDYNTISQNFMARLLESKKYTIVDRQVIDKVLQEQSLSQSGVIDHNSLVTLGKLIGADKIVKGRIYYTAMKEYAVQIEVVDITTARIEFSATWKDLKLVNPGTWAAGSIISRYALLGTVVGVADSIVVVSLGENDGVRKGERLFWARIKTIKDAKGTVIFSKVERQGKLIVDDVAASTSVVSTSEALIPGMLPKADDIVSTEPIPFKQASVMRTPYFPNFAQGRLILNDDMEKIKYLAPVNSKGDAYIDGKLSLNATALNTGQAVASYPAPFNELRDFVVEWEMEYKLYNPGGINCGVYIRSNLVQGNQDSYCLMASDDGRFFIGYYKGSVLTYVIKPESCPHLNRGGKINRFKMVAKGAQFDVYINDNYVLSFEDEKYDQGGISLITTVKNHVMFDNVKIWEF